LLRSALFALAVLAFFALSGCGESEEATQGESAARTDTTEAKPYDQALTSFVGEKKVDSTQAEAKPAAQPTSTAEDIQKQMDALKTDNTDLRQRNLKLEDDVQKLTARLNDAESKYAAERDRADKAEEALKTAPARPVTETKKTEAVETAIKTEIPMAEYEEALGAFKSKKYDDATTAFQKMLDQKVPDEIADNCHYWIGESKYAKKKYKEALEEFDAVMAFKRSEKKGDAQFMIAQCYERMGDKAKAKEAFEKVVKDFPMNAHVKRAKERWAKL
jgi:tol-pal system protein YbgF